MTKVWQGAIKRCHDVDHEGSGIIRRAAFLTALSQEGLAQAVAIRLADTYATDSDAGPACVDYMSCFRRFLEGKAEGRGGRASFGRPKSASATVSSSAFPRAAASGFVSPHKNHPSRAKSGVHPWEFVSEKRMGHNGPLSRKELHNYTGPKYWQQATARPRDIVAEVEARPLTAGEMLDNYHANRNPRADAPVVPTDKAPELLRTLTAPGTIGAAATAPAAAAAAADGVIDAERVESRPTTPATRRPKSAAAAALSSRGGSSSRSALIPTLKDLTPFEKARVLSKYNDATINFCRKVYQNISAQNWKNLLFDLRQHQMNRHKGHILSETFFEILAGYRVRVNSNDMGAATMGFRGLGGGHVIRYDEFVKICRLVKLLDAEGLQ